ncbi:type II toxin-antitoxin system death-on-curing family toxin [Mycolicibacterium sp. CR10]|uniref:type II toxin-antitoxin system death-on-curing family toxin n=1 Tax=Mycolicibacterium sp. CR10 TaxID=2562314 RepID=UPI0010C025A6|nr:type II toxin-antitoxin system death-on-curing family toxin [Mycolicibacterium sp. CR10]
MTEYLDRDDVLTAGSIAFGGELKVRDYGLLDAAVARPQATVFGVDAYPEVWDKAAALLQSLARNHALVDGNKRTAWAAAWTFLHLNGFELAADFDVDRAERLMNEVATRECDLTDIAASLLNFVAST